MHGAMQFINQPEAEDDDAWWDRFEDLLDDQNDWPTQYTFKFIAPASQLDELKAVFGDHPVRVRESSKGNYKSVTAHLQMSSSEEVVNVYEKASGIEDVIAL
jgi:putative lipoic acid-binding regulatory protein